MSIIITLDENEFIKQFEEYRPNDFSIEALRELFNYYDSFDDLEFDPVSIACEWSEYSPSELKSAYDYMLDQDDDMSDDEYIDELFDLLDTRTTIFDLNGSYLIQEF